MATLPTRIMLIVVSALVVAATVGAATNEDFFIKLKEDETSPVVDWNKNASACMINVRLIYDFVIRDETKSLYDFHFNLVSCKSRDSTTCKDISKDWPKCQNLCNLENRFASCFKLTADGNGKFIYVDLALSKKKHYPDSKTQDLYFGMKMRSPVSEDEKSISTPFLVSSDDCSSNNGLGIGIAAGIGALILAALSAAGYCIKKKRDGGANAVPCLS